MRSGIITILSAVIFALFNDSTSLAQRSGYSVNGVVRVGSTIRSPEIVRVRLQRFGMTIQEVVQTNGAFQLWDIEPGNYTLSVEVPGYETTLQDVRVPGEWVVVNLRSPRSAVEPVDAVSVWELKVPSSARRQFEIAQTKLRKDNCAEALDHLRKAVRLYDQYGEAHKALGQCYAQMNQLEAAEQEVKRALEQPHKPDLHLLLVNIYTREGKDVLRPHELELFAEETPNQRR